MAPDTLASRIAANDVAMYAEQVARYARACHNAARGAAMDARLCAREHGGAPDAKRLLSLAEGSEGACARAAGHAAEAAALADAASKAAAEGRLGDARNSAMSAARAAGGAAAWTTEAEARADDARRLAGPDHAMEAIPAPAAGAP